VSKEHRGTKAYFLIYAELIAAARHRGTVTYQELADLVGLPHQGNYMGSELGSYLGAISEDEVRYGRPMLSAIAVTTAGKPGGGFFGLAQQLGILKGDSESDKQAYWEAQKRAVYETWQRSFKSHQP
jgi:hypothetical protein